ncbi:MAG TPA: CocE/NonD family hydrolase [Caulobacteraceae bacterium]|nr:CocE/NonD family hydrolase [Caulobacteraceae bacterium]
MPPTGGVTMIENVFVERPDGVKLAVQLWLPEGGRPAPAVLETVPYRKRDDYRPRGLYWGPKLASHGIAYARLDTRGSGDSTGLLEDEYLPSEQEDAAAVVAWLAAQPWCNGAVGMRGVSWGGFITLQTAALAPPALNAIMPMCASDMRFTDDAHFVGGAFALTGLKWAASMKLVMAGPPDPEITGEAWRVEWKHRLAATPAITARWLSHQTNDDYWRQGSVGLDPAAIRCPTYLVGGLVDPYCNFIPRLLERLTVPRKAIFGPWRHGYPQPAAPGPALDWAFEEVRWWREHLAGEATGVMAEPMLRVFMPDAAAGEVGAGPIPGRWIAEAAWPAPSLAPRSYHIGPAGLSREAQAPERRELDASEVVGLGNFEWCPYAPPEYAGEQSADDERALSFDSPPLEDDLEILGAPVLRIGVACDRPVAHLAARLCEVAPEGRSWLVAWGVLNLSHRDSDADPAPLEPGKFYEIEVPLHFTAHRFKRGGRVRLALSQSLWPLVWPPPQSFRLTLDTASARLELPVRPPPAAEAPMPIPPWRPSRSDPAAWPKVEISRAEGRVRLVEAWPHSSAELADVGVTVIGAGPNVDLSMTVGEPLTCAWSAVSTAGFERPGWDVSLRAEISVTSTAATFRIEERLLATLNGEVEADVRHATDVPRRLM